MSNSDFAPSGSIEDQAVAWHTRLHSGTASAVDRAAFEAWLKQGADYARAYRELEVSWNRLDALRNRAASELAAARAYRAPPRRQTRPLFWVTTAAFGVILMAVVRFLEPRWTTEVQYRTAKGENRSEILPDGSRIDINTDTELTVRYSLLKRTAQLHRGEALFDVKHEAIRPFEVRAGSGVIRDIGTRFDVLESAGHVTLTVLEGEVSVDNGKTSRTLRAGLQAIYSDDEKLTLGTAGDTSTLTAWREGKLIFRSRPLQEVAEQVARYHDIELHIVSPELRDLKVSGSFATSDLPLLLTAIETSLPVKLIRTNPGSIRIEPQ